MRKAVLGLSIVAISALAHGQTNNYPNGSTVSDFTVTDTHGQVHNLNTYAAQGKYVLLDFFFYNCGPCQGNAPYYSELYQTYGCNGGNLICIEINDGSDSDAQTEAFSEVFAPNFSHPPAVGSGGGSALTTTFGVTAFPTFALISPAKIMLNQDIYPINNMQTFVNAFPANSGLVPQACVVGIDEKDVARFTEVFPVPSTGLISLNIDSRSSAKINLEVLNTLGQQVHTELLKGSTGNSMHNLDLSFLADGQYVLKMYAGQQRADIQRIVIAH